MKYTFYEVKGWLSNGKMECYLAKTRKEADETKFFLKEMQEAVVVIIKKFVGNVKADDIKVFK